MQSNPSVRLRAEPPARAAGAITQIKWAIPWLLLSMRLLMVPFMVLASHGLADKTILWLYLIAFVTDYFDGVTARYFGTATPLLRRADSTADAIFHLALAFLILRHHPQEFSKSAIALVVYLLSAGLWYILDAFRWRRPAGFHAYSAKLFSIGLLVWMVMLFGGWTTGHLLSGILVFGTVSNVEGIAISLLLRHDNADVPSVFHALRRRRESNHLPSAAAAAC
ncbi:MAG: CDP-alcohol phosphatidyltransferase family protein [Planctomycetota bacterium]|nr:CDP-alcohol phosphatidyltransferase family protein [Planctomycetota bacterium]